MENAIKKIPGVNDASVSFMTQKMSIDAEDAKFDEIYEKKSLLFVQRLSGLQNLILMNQWLLRDAASFYPKESNLCGIKSGKLQKGMVK